MNSQHFSSKGQVVVVDTSAHVGQFYAMQVIAETVVASMVFEPGYVVIGDWSDLTTIPAGVTLFGRFTSITLTSGEVILHVP